MVQQKVEIGIDRIGRTRIVVLRSRGRPMEKCGIFTGCIQGPGQRLAYRAISASAELLLCSRACKPLHTRESMNVLESYFYTSAIGENAIKTTWL